MHPRDPTLPIVPTEPLPNSAGRTLGNSLKSRIRINFVAATAASRAKYQMTTILILSAVFSPVSVRRNVLTPRLYVPFLTCI